MSRHRRLRARRAPLIAVAAALVAIGAVACGVAAPARTGSAPGQTVTVTATTGRAVPTGFVGISMEYKGLEQYAGADASAPNPGFLQLLRNLAPSGGAVLRIGGDSSDWTWWPVPGMNRPGGVKLNLTSNWAAVAKSVAAAIHGRLILGINFEADSSKLAAYEESQLLSHVGGAGVLGFELGNEPELYASFPWFKTADGQHVYGRARGYNVSDYLNDFGRIAAALPHAPLAGPSSGSANWLADLSTFVTHEPRVSLLTVHAYPTKKCSKLTRVSAGQLFETSSLQGLANQIGSWVQVAATHKLPLRVDEMNSVSCGGEAGLSNSFAPALWALDMLPRLVQAGVAGVNFHTVPDSINAIFSAAHSASGWAVSAQPEYLGLLAFVQAAPAGSQLLKVSAPATAGLDAWATKTPSGQVHVVLVNTSSSAQTLTVDLAGVASGTTATVSRLRAAGLAATTATLNGQSLSARTGALGGTPVASHLAAHNGGYTVSVPATSAAILTTGSS